MEPNMPKFFRLIATLPYSFISKCVATVPRPPWESYMYYAVVSAMIVLFFGALITSYYDAKKLILTTYSGGGDRRPIRPKKQIVISKDGKLMTTGGAGFHALKESQNGAADSGFSLLANDYITTRNNPDGTQGYVLDFKSQNANARHSHSSAVTKASKCEMASKRLVIKIVNSLLASHDLFFTFMLPLLPFEKVPMYKYLVNKRSHINYTSRVEIVEKLRTKKSIVGCFSWSHLQWEGMRNDYNFICLLIFDV